MVTHTRSTNNQEVEIGGSEAQGSPRLHSKFKVSLRSWCHIGVSVENSTCTEAHQFFPQHPASSLVCSPCACFRFLLCWSKVLTSLSFCQQKVYEGQVRSVPTPKRTEAMHSCKSRRLASTLCWWFYILFMLSDASFPRMG